MRIRVAAYGVIIRDGLLLLARLHGHSWTLPGGGLEAGEDPAAAAVREIREETGFRVSLGAPLGVDTIEVDIAAGPDGAARRMRGVRHLFVATVVGGKLTHEVGGTTDQAGWFALDQVPDLRRVELGDVALNRWRTAAAR
jgi:ADP-ribose pyrophosphatase YjhB (NUDIX family)